MVADFGGSSRRRGALSLALALALLGLGACGEGRVVPGDPTRFDPIASFGEVAAFAGDDLKLVRLSARGVAEDGTVNLEDTRFAASVEVQFVRRVGPPPNAPPIGAGGSDTWHQSVTIELRRAGSAGTETDEYGTRQVVTKGMRRVEREPDAGPLPEGVMPPPRCGFATLWRVAAAEGAPAGAVALIDYVDDRYRFRITGTGVHLEFDSDCARIAG